MSSSSSSLDNGTTKAPGVSPAGSWFDVPPTSVTVDNWIKAALGESSDWSFEAPAGVAWTGPLSDLPDQIQQIRQQQFSTSSGKSSLLGEENLLNDFEIAVVLGPSGSGKTQVAQQLRASIGVGAPVELFNELTFRNDQALISHEALSVGSLSSVGLNKVEPLLGMFSEF